jgi:hypothetical protein
MKLLTYIIFIIAMVLLWSVSWKIAIGVLMFGWGMNLENN